MKEGSKGRDNYIRSERLAWVFVVTVLSGLVALGILIGLMF